MSSKHDDQDNQPALRRSSRSTRGSVKPLINLKKEEVEDNDEEVGENLEDVKEVKPSRRSSVKPASAKKSTTKRGTVSKKATSKQNLKEDKEAEDRSVAVKEEQQEKPAGIEEMVSDEEDVKLDTSDCFYDLSEKEMKEINNAFDLNRISDDEELLNSSGVRTAIRSLGFEPRGDEIKKLMKMFATKKSGNVTRDGFHKIMIYKFSTTPTMRNDRSNDEISRVFNLLDLDKTGLITIENLRAISKELNEELTNEDLHEMISEADLDGDFKINKDEFHDIMKKTSLY